MATKQTFHHEAHGPIEFTDKNESERSRKAQSRDIQLLAAMSDRTVTAEIKRAICDDINSTANT